MAFTPGVLIEPVVETTQSSYINSGSSLYHNAFLLSDPTISEFTLQGYIAQGSKAFSRALLLPDPTISEFGYPVVTIEKTFIFGTSASIYVSVLPHIPGDTGTLIIVGALCQFSYTILSLPYLIKFIDETLGEVAEWHWDFGDGNFSEEQNPTHPYDPGTYDVRLDVKFVSGEWGFFTAHLILPAVPFDFGFIVKAEEPELYDFGFIVKEEGIFDLGFIVKEEDVYDIGFIVKEEPPIETLNVGRVIFVIGNNSQVIAINNSAQGFKITPPAE